MNSENATTPVLSSNVSKNEHIWDNIFKSGPSKICGRQPLKSLKGYGQPKKIISLEIFIRLSSTSFAWSTLEYFVPFIRANALLSLKM